MDAAVKADVDAFLRRGDANLRDPLADRSPSSPRHGERSRQARSVQPACARSDRLEEALERPPPPAGDQARLPGQRPPAAPRGADGPEREDTSLSPATARLVGLAATSVSFAEASEWPAWRSTPNRSIAEALGREVTASPDCAATGAAMSATTTPAMPAVTRLLESVRRTVPRRHVPGACPSPLVYCASPEVTPGPQGLIAPFDPCILPCPGRRFNDAPGGNASIPPPAPARNFLRRTASNFTGEAIENPRSEVAAEVPDRPARAMHYDGR